jgi:hypothetical protein
MESNEGLMVCYHMFADDGHERSKQNELIYALYATI